LRDPRPTADLLTLALDESREGYGPGSAHEALVVLQARATREVLEEALALCRHPTSGHRILGARILGELGAPERAFPQECGAQLLDLAANDPEIDVVIQAIVSLGHLRHEYADNPVIIGYRKHPNDRVRHAVAFALCGNTSMASVEALLDLMNDSDPLVRDWATTAIGGIVAIDGPEIREALLERVTDQDEITRAEAIHGLARRHDERVVPHLVYELTHLNELPYLFEDAASCYLGLDENQKIDPEFLLIALRY
jgi:HEAT repeat protein